jgi:hypothetical protein
MCQDFPDFDEDDCSDNDDDFPDWDDIDEKQSQKERKMTIPDNSQVALIGVIFQPENETPWLVRDNRKALKNEFSCETKADVLDQIAIILDDMDQSKDHT